MNNTTNHLMREFVKTHKNLRHKYKVMKADIAKVNSHWEETFHPNMKSSNFSL